MQEPGLDGRYRDQRKPLSGQIRAKNGNALNGNLPQPIPGFRADATVATMRKVTGQHGLAGIRAVALKTRGK
jgi:hypothetical protein